MVGTATGSAWRPTWVLWDWNSSVGYGSATIAAAGWGRGGVGFRSPDLGSPGHPSLRALPSLWPVVPGLHPGQFQPLRPEAVPAH